MLHRVQEEPGQALLGFPTKSIINNDYAVKPQQQQKKLRKTWFGEFLNSKTCEGFFRVE